MTTGRTPVVFIHGLWLHATSRAPWVELFSEAGYAPVAPGWPGDPDTVEAARANPDSIADHGIDDVTGHYQGIIDGLPSRPDRGHSLTIDSGWREVADACLAWLGKQGW